MSILSKAIDEYLANQYLGFHTPSHSGLLNPRDLSELDGLDNLQYPNSVLLESQKKAAELFGAAQSFFLLNGASIGLQAAILALAKHIFSNPLPVLVSRNVHKSVLAGIIIAGLEVEWLEPIWDEGLGVYARINFENYDFSKYSALIITNPSYEGFYSQIPELDIPIIVDEAHGAHYIFSDLLPRSALESGADIVIQSWHKCLGTYTQTGVAHISKRSKIPALFFEEALRLLQTTSPSYLFLENLSLAVEFFSENGSKVFEEAVSRVLVLSDRVVKNDDPLRVILKGNGLNIEQELLARKIVVESAYSNFALLFVNFTHDELAIKKLSLGLDFDFGRSSPILKPIWGDSVLGMREAFFEKSKLVDKELALNKISAELYAPCPPGIPILVPGQLITESSLRYLHSKQQIAIIDSP